MAPICMAAFAEPVRLRETLTCGVVTEKLGFCESSIAMGISTEKSTPERGLGVKVQVIRQRERQVVFEHRRQAWER